MYNIKAEVLPSFIIILMGSIDCITTVIGVLYFGAAETNPLLTGVVNTNILAFMVLKVIATLCIASTYVLSKKMLNKTEDKSTKSFHYGKAFVKLAYAGLVVFLIAVVTNNLIVLLF